MINFLRSIIKSIFEALANNEYILRWGKKHPVFFEFLRDRLSLKRQYGLFFSIGVLSSAIVFISFLSIIQDILARDPFIEADIRIMNLIVALRTIKIAKFFLFFTYFGNWQIILSLIIIIVIILWSLNEKRKIVFFLISFVCGEFSFAFFKMILHRTRPGIGFSLIAQKGYAFPSGHATTAFLFYGMTGYYILKIFDRLWQKALVIAFILLIIFLIGISRIYLGVHWASDITAGWLLGLTILILFITLNEDRDRFLPEIKSKRTIPKKLSILIAVLLIVFEVIFVRNFYIKHPLLQQPFIQTDKVNITAKENLEPVILSDKFPKFSETLLGEKMEPISFVFVGSREKINQAFIKSGWFIADNPYDIANIYKIAVAAILNNSYPTAPTTPSFLNTMPNDFAFEKPTKENTVRQRHHIRFWHTQYYFDGSPVWVATASYDTDLHYYITHKISPAIDTERDFIKDNLVSTGFVKLEKKIQLVEPLLGKNQAGDEFFTDGKAYIITMKNGMKAD